MEIVVTGRHLEVSDQFRSHVEEKLAKLEKYDQRIIRVEVEVAKEANPRQPDQAIRLQITINSRGPLLRAEAMSDDKLTALDKAVERLVRQARKAQDRRRVHHGQRTPESLAEALARRAPLPEPADVNGAADTADAEDLERKVGPLTVLGDGPLVVREKTHTASPMTLDQALYEMELVGHDFFLFIDSADDQPAVVYRRKGYDYGVIKLATDENSEVATG